LLAAAVSVCGCQEQPKIASYTVPAPVSTKHRLLVAMFARPGNIWFFRLDGPEPEIAEQAAAFEQLVQSVRFAAADEPPVWTMPAGWQREPGNQFRYATLRAGKLEGRVSQLPGTEQAAAVLPNLSRFRNEVGLPQATEADLAKDTKPIIVNEVTGTWIDVTGPGGKAKGPMMKF
jgi:hypothetical protein